MIVLTFYASFSTLLLGEFNIFNLLIHSTARYLHHIRINGYGYTPLEDFNISFFVLHLPRLPRVRAEWFSHILDELPCHGFALGIQGFLPDSGTPPFGELSLA